MKRLKELRNEKGLTQKELAKKIASTDKSIWAYENNVAMPPLDVLLKLADVFECSIDYLVSRADDFGNVSIQNNAPALSSDEQRLIDTYRKLNTKNRIHVSAYAEVRWEEQSKN